MRRSRSHAPRVLLILLPTLLAARPAAAGWAEGKQAYDAGRFEEAVAEFRAGAERNPEVAQWHFWLGAALFRLDRAGEAAPSLARAVELDGDRPEYRLLLAQARLASGSPADALAALGSIQIAGLDANARSGYAQLLAVAAGRADDPARTRRQLELAVGELTDSAPLWFALGKARKAAGDQLPAFEAFARSYELAPSDLDAGRTAVQTGFAAAQAEEGDARAGWYARAGEVAGRLAEATGERGDRITAGEAWLSAKDFGRARGWFEKAGEAAPGDPQVEYYLGRCDLGEDETRKALGHLDKALAKAGDPELRRSIQSQRGYALHLLADYDGAAAAYRAAGDEESARTAEKAAAAADENRRFAQLQSECRERIQKLEEGRDDLERLGAKHEVEVVERRLADVRQECAPYLGEPAG